MTDPWHRAARRVYVIGSVITGLVTKGAAAVAMAGIARAVWALVDHVLLRAGTP